MERSPAKFQLVIASDSAGEFFWQPVLNNNTNDWYTSAPILSQLLAVQNSEDTVEKKHEKKKNLLEAAVLFKCVKKSLIRK